MKETEMMMHISRYAGMREDLVQAGGGNTSVKISEDRMLIKASGYQLADVTEQDGYAVVNPQVITEYFKSVLCGQIDSSQEKEILEKAFIEGRRPSIETFLHSVTDKVTLHTHPVLVDILAVRKGGMEILKNIIPEALIVPYATPGINLAKEYFKVWVTEKKQSSVIFLKNHGMIVSGRTIHEVIEQNEDIIKKIASYLNIDYEPYQMCSEIYNALNEVGENNDIVCLARDRHIYEAYKKIGNTWNFSFCPDCIVYCGKKVLKFCDKISVEYIKEYKEKYGKPVIAFYKGFIFILAPSVKKAKEIESIFGFSAQIAMENRDKEIDLLSEKEQDFLLGWDAEKYRKNMK